MRRMHLKKSRSIKLSNKIIIIVIMILISIVLVFKLFNDKAIPLFIKYSEIETKKIATIVLNSTVTEEVTNNYDMDKLFITTNDSSGNVTSIDFNSIMVNEILSNTSKIAETNLKALENGKTTYINKSNGVIFELPSGIIFNNTILNNVLPKIPVKLELVGSIFSKIDTSVKAYGINNSLIEVYVSISVNLRILLPFTSLSTTVTTKIPIAIKAIQGKIPNYYINGYLDTPSLTTTPK